MDPRERQQGKRRRVRRIARQEDLPRDERLAQLRERLAIARFALRSITTAISEREGFSDELAMSLGAQHTSYYAEVVGYGAEIARLEGDSEHAESLTNAHALIVNEVRNAARGDYTGVRYFIADFGRKTLTHAVAPINEGGEIDQNWLKAIRGFSLLELALPEQGEPFSPPMPAFTNPEIVRLFKEYQATESIQQKQS